MDRTARPNRNTNEPQFERAHPEKLIITKVDELQLYVAGTRLTVRSHEGIAPTTVVQSRLTPFLASDPGPAHVQLTAHYVPPAEPYSESSQITARTSDSGTLFTAPQFKLSLAPDTMSGRITYQGSFEQVLGALRLALAHHLIETKRGLLLHASSALFNGQGHLFPGPSGTGKSTAIATTPGTILGDEISALLLHGDTPLLLGTPFGNRLLPSAKIAHEVQVYRLLKGKRDSLNPLSMAQGVGLLLGSTVYLPTSGVEGQRVLEVASRLAECVSFHTLECTIEGKYWTRLLKTTTAAHGTNSTRGVPHD